MQSSDKPRASQAPQGSQGTQWSSFTVNRILLKAKYSFYSALVFFLFANPESFAVLQRVFGHSLTVITSSGAPTIHGIFISTFLFFMTMLGLMLLPSE